MRLTIIGSGGWGGIPAAFCNCGICHVAKENPEGKDFRNRPLVYVSTEKGAFLIEISPDIRLQSVYGNLPPIKDFVLSHDHFDHISGLMQLNSWIKFILQEKPTIYCSSLTAKKLDLKDEEVPKKIVIHKPYESFSLYDIVITPVPLYHQSENDKGKPTKALRQDFGFIMQHNGKKAVYLGDYYKLPSQTFNLIKNADLITIDATYIFQEQYPNKPEQEGLKNDPDHLHGKDILTFAKECSAKQTIYTNITHLSELTHEKMQNKLPKDHFIAYDGMECILE